jgi:hypothetical protein
MDLRSISEKIQYGFEWLKDSLEPIEHRWMVFIIAVIMIILFKAAGAAGMSLLIALVYIMYFVSLKQ